MFNYLNLYNVIYIMSFFLGNKNYDDGLNLAVQRMCNNNLRLKKKCEKE